MTVSATSAPMLIAMAAGGAGADQADVAGSVTINSVANVVAAYITGGSVVSASGDLDVTASESSMEVVVAGDGGVAGAAIGAALACNYVGQSFNTANPDEEDEAETSDGSSEASISDSTAIVGGNLLVSAGYQPQAPLPGTTSATINGDTGFGTTLSIPVPVDGQLVSVAVGGAGADTFALGGDLTLNFIRETIQATISDNSTVTTTGSMTVTAIDASSIGTGAGAVATSQGSAAVGAAIATNDIANNLTADIANSAVTSTASSVSVVTQEETTITAVGAGGSGASSFAIGGSVVVNVIKDTSDAEFTSSTVKADTGVLVSSSDSSTINVGAGEVSVASGGAAIAENAIADTTDATIDSSTVTTPGTIQVLAATNAPITAVATGGAGGDSSIQEGSVVNNTVVDTTDASITGSPNISAASVTVSSSDNSTIKVGAGQVSISTGGTAKGAAEATNTINDTTDATIDSSSVTASGTIQVLASTDSPITAVAAGGVGGEDSAKGGSVVTNTITDTTDADIANSQDISAAGVIVSSNETSSINVGAGQVSIATGGSAVGASLVTNTITDTTDAEIDNSTVTTPGTIQVLAATNAPIIAVAAGGAGASSFAMGGSVVNNTITDATDADITSSQSITAAGVTVSAGDTSTIDTGAGQVSIATGYGAVGAAIAVSTIDNTVEADVDDSTVSSSGAVDVSATSGETILIVAAGVGGSVPSTVLGGAAVGSGAVNVITDNTQALIEGNSSVTTTGGSGVDLTATDDSSITAGAGALSIQYSSGDASISVAVGASTAMNTIGGPKSPDQVTAAVEGSTVDAAGSVAVTAIASPSIESITAAGSGSVTDGSLASVGFDGAGSGSINTISTTVEALINGGSIVTTTDGGGVSLTATGSSTIEAIAGGVAFAGATASNLAGIQVSVGAAAAVNTIVDSSLAIIEGSTVDSAGAVSLSASNNETIDAYAVGVAAALSTGSAAGLQLSGAGSGSANTVNDRTKALIEDSSTNGITTPSTVSSGQPSQSNPQGSDVDLNATENVTILSVAGSGVFNFASSSIGGVTAAVGVSAASNSIADTVEANINDSTVNAGGNVALSASTQHAQGKDSIEAITVAGGIGVGNSGTFDTTLDGAGAYSNNSVSNTVTSSITGGASVTTTKGSVILSALDNSSIQADGGGATIAIAAASVPVSVAIGAGAAYNTITDTNSAYIEASKVTAADMVSLDANSTATINSTAFGVSASVAVGGGAAGAGAGSGAASKNTIKDTIEAYIQDGSTVTVSGTEDDAVRLSAVDHSRTTSNSGAGSLAVSGGGGAALSLAAGASDATNLITNTIEAYIGDPSRVADSTLVSSAGDVVLSATSRATADAISIALAASAAASEVSAAIAASGAASTNTINNTITAAIQNGTTVDANGTEAGDSVDVVAMDDSTISANVGSGGLAIAVVGPSAGVSAASNTVSDSVNAFINGATVTTMGSDVDVTAQSMSSITGESVATAVNISFGGSAAGGVCTSTDNTTTTAYVGPGSTIQTDGSGVNISPTYGALDVTATDVGGSVNAQTDCGEGALASIGAFYATANVGGSTTAYLNGGSSLNVGNLAVMASTGHNVSSTTNVVVIGALGCFGTSATTTLDEDVEAYLGTQANAPPSITATTYAPQGTVTITAKTADTGASQASDGLAGSVGISGDSADSTVEPTVEAYVSDNVNVTTPDDMSVLASATNTATSTITGIEVTAFGVGVSDAQTTDSATVAAYVGDGALTVGGNLDISATSTDIATTNSQASGGSFVVSGGGAVADATITPNVHAYAGDSSGGANINATGTAAITALETPYADSVATGIQVSLGLAVGVVTSDASVSGNTVSNLGDNSVLSANSLMIQATQTQDANQDPTADASSMAGAGGILAGVDATSSSASIGGKVQAYTGSAVTLPDGDVSILASNQTSQSANATGVAAGYYFAAGGNTATASSAVATSATLGASPIMSPSRSGSLSVLALGVDQNAVSSTAGSGGLVAGDAAIGDTGDSSTVQAVLTSGTIIAGVVTAEAMNTSDYAPNVNSVNAAVVGASGSSATNSNSTSASTSIGNDTTINATGLVTIAAQNSFAETTSGSSVSAGAGGVVSGSAALSTTSLNGTASVSLGCSVVITSGTNPFSNPGGIVLSASSTLNSDDLVTLTTGGFIDGAGTDSEIDAILNNMVTIGAQDSLTSEGNIGAGTFGNVNAQTNSEASASAAAAVGDAQATTNVTVNQLVTVGASTTMTAFGNVNLTAGQDPTGQIDTIIGGGSNAQAYTEGVVGIPTDTATTSVTSKTKLVINNGDLIDSGQDATIGGFPGNPSAIEVGQSRYAIARIPVTNSSSTDPAPTITSSVT